LALVVSDDIRGHYYFNDGEIYSGDRYAVIAGLTGVSAIIAAIVLMLVTSKPEYLILKNYGRKLQMFFNKLECLSLAGLSMLVQYL
jgi:hypothetical protein